MARRKQRRPSCLSFLQIRTCFCDSLSGSHSSAPKPPTKSLPPTLQAGGLIAAWHQRDMSQRPLSHITPAQHSGQMSWSDSAKCRRARKQPCEPGGAWIRLF